MGPVLIGLDGSPEAAAALHWGAWFASRTGGHLQVAHVWPHGQRLELPAALAGDDPDLEGEGPDRIRERLAESADESLDEVTVPIEALVLRGPISGALLEQASRHENALIAVGAMGEGGALRSMLGSVSRELTEQPSEPVVVVPTDPALPQNGDWSMVVGVDGSTSSSRAIRWAGRAAAEGGGRVVAVHAVEFPQPDLTPAQRDCVVEEMRSRADEEWCAPLRNAGVEYTTVVKARPAATLLSRTADEIEPACVVVGSRGLGTVATKLLGSVTHRLVRELDWPVVVIPGTTHCPTWPPAVAN